MSIDDYQTEALQQQIFAVHWRGMAAICAKHEALKPLQSGFLQIAARHEVNGEFYRHLAQKIVDEKELKMIQARQMKRILTLLVLVVLLATGGVSWAEDATVEPSPLTPLPQGDTESTLGAGGDLVQPDIVVVPADDGGQTVVIREDEGFRARDWVLVGVIVVLGLLLGTQGRTLIQPAILELSKSVPMPVLEIALAGARAGVTELSNIAAKSDNTIDDAAAAELRAGMADLEKQIREIRAIAYRTKDATNIPDHK